MAGLQPGLILAAGMPRSASTWLYNAARLILSSDTDIFDNLSYGWIGDFTSIPQKPYMLIKVHDYNENLAQQSLLILYSYRDIRDAVASSVRKFNAQPNITMVDNMVAQDQLWSSKAHFIMRYEDMLSKPGEIIVALAKTLKQDKADESRTLSTLDALAYESPGNKNKLYNTANLYHKDHVTDGRHGSWVDTLQPQFISDIEARHAAWLTSHGYTVSQ